MTPDEQQTDVSVHLERRRSPRVTPVGLIRGLSSDGDSVALLNVSAGGLVIHGPSFHALDDVIHLEFAIEPSTIITVVGRVVHVVRVSAADGQSYVAGLEFVDSEAPEHRAAIEQLLGAIGVSPAR